MRSNRPGSATFTTESRREGNARVPSSYYSVSDFPAISPRHEATSLPSQQQPKSAGSADPAVREMKGDESSLRKAMNRILDEDEGQVEHDAADVDRGMDSAFPVAPRENTRSTLTQDSQTAALSGIPGRRNRTHRSSLLRHSKSFFRNRVSKLKSESRSPSKVREPPTTKDEPAGDFASADDASKEGVTRKVLMNNDREMASPISQLSNPSGVQEYDSDSESESEGSYGTCDTNEFSQSTMSSRRVHDKQGLFGNILGMNAKAFGTIAESIDQFFDGRSFDSDDDETRTYDSRSVASMRRNHKKSSEASNSSSKTSDNASSKSTAQTNNRRARERRGGVRKIRSNSLPGSLKPGEGDAEVNLMFDPPTLKRNRSEEEIAAESMVMAVETLFANKFIKCEEESQRSPTVTFAAAVPAKGPPLPLLQHDERIPESRKSKRNSNNPVEARNDHGPKSMESSMKANSNAESRNDRAPESTESKKITSSTVESRNNRAPESKEPKRKANTATESRPLENGVRRPGHQEKITSAQPPKTPIQSRPSPPDQLEEVGKLAVSRKIDAAEKTNVNSRPDASRKPETFPLEGKAKRGRKATRKRGNDAQKETSAEKNKTPSINQAKIVSDRPQEAARSPLVTRGRRVRQSIGDVLLGRRSLSRDKKPAEKPNHQNVEYPSVEGKSTAVTTVRGTTMAVSIFPETPFPPVSDRLVLGRSAGVGVATNLTMNINKGLRSLSPFSRGENRASVAVKALPKHTISSPSEKSSGLDSEPLLNETNLPPKTSASASHASTDKPKRTPGASAHPKAMQRTKEKNPTTKHGVATNRGRSPFNRLRDLSPLARTREESPAPKEPASPTPKRGGILSSIRRRGKNLLNSDPKEEGMKAANIVEVKSDHSESKVRAPSGPSRRKSPEESFDSAYDPSYDEHSTIVDLSTEVRRASDVLGHGEAGLFCANITHDVSDRCGEGCSFRIQEPESQPQICHVGGVDPFISGIQSQIEAFMAGLTSTKPSNSSLLSRTSRDVPSESKDGALSTPVGLTRQQNVAPEGQTIRDFLESYKDEIGLKIQKTFSLEYFDEVLAQASIDLSSLAEKANQNERQITGPEPAGTDADPTMDKTSRAPPAPSQSQNPPPGSPTAPQADSLQVEKIPTSPSAMVRQMVAPSSRSRKKLAPDKSSATVRGMASSPPPLPTISPVADKSTTQKRAKSSSRRDLSNVSSKRDLAKVYSVMEQPVLLPFVAANEEKVGETEDSKYDWVQFDSQIAFRGRRSTMKVRTKSNARSGEEKEATPDPVGARTKMALDPMGFPMTTT